MALRVTVPEDGRCALVLPITHDGETWEVRVVFTVNGGITDIWEAPRLTRTKLEQMERWVRTGSWR